MKKVLFLLVILMTAAVSSASARTNNDFSCESLMPMPVDPPCEVDLVASDGDIIHACVTSMYSFSRIFYTRPVNINTIEFIRRNPFEVHVTPVGKTVSYMSVPFVTTGALWDVTLITSDGKQYKGKVQIDSTEPGPDPDPWIIK